MAKVLSEDLSLYLRNLTCYKESVINRSKMESGLFLH